MNILAVGAHWDDVELGCGLTLLDWSRLGHRIFIAVLTNSETIMEGHIRTAKDAWMEGIEAANVLGASILHLVQGETSNLQYNQPMMQTLEEHIKEQAIDIAMIHWHGDVNTDHKASAEICRVACRRVPSVLAYASNSYEATPPFVPTVFTTFTLNQAKAKIEMLSLHKTAWEYRGTRWEREIFDRERFWGYLQGADYAEGFVPLRLQMSTFWR